MKPNGLCHHTPMLTGLTRGEGDGRLCSWRMGTVISNHNHRLLFLKNRRKMMHDPPPMFGNMESIITHSSMFTNVVFLTHPLTPSLVTLHFSNWGRANVCHRASETLKAYTETLSQVFLNRVTYKVQYTHWQRYFLRKRANCTNKSNDTF